MSSEQQIRLQFLEEAEDYLNQIETGLLGISSETNLNRASLDAVLRSAHSIKGGAAMMGYQTLSDITHRLEDFFKIIHSRKLPQIETKAEQLFLRAVDQLRQCIDFYRQGEKTIDQNWLEETIQPILTSLEDIFGNPKEEDTVVSIEVNQSSEDTLTLIFQTEIDNMLSQLESQLSQQDLEAEELKENFLLMAEQFVGLGMMLDLSALTELSSSISGYLQEADSEQINWIATEALKSWRQTQALALTGHINLLPKKLNLDSSLQETASTEPEEKEVVKAEPIEFLELAKMTSVPEEATLENTEQTIRIPLRQLEEVSNYFSELIIERNGINLQLQSLQSLVKLLGERVKRLENSNEELRTVYDLSNEQKTNSPISLPFPSLQETSPTLRAATLRSPSGTFLHQWAGGNTSTPTGTFPSTPNITSSSSITSDFDSLEMDSYTTLHPVLQDLMEIIVQIQEVNVDLEYNLEGTQRIARDLSRTSQLMQSKLTSLRMRPISDLLGRLPRALRDLELKYGKQVELKILGGNTLVDRPVLEALNEPLLHLVRNAFDHGIETAESRLAQNKPAKGTITISSAYRGNQTIIRVSDDGQGIDLAKVRQKALTMGITEAELEQTSEADLLELIFTSGFSTATKVTDLSGRGVGLDVVRNNLDSIKGQINVETQAGEGTSFIMSVPLTLSIIRILLVEISGILLSIPTNAIEEMILSSKTEYLLEEEKQFIQWENKKIILINLEQWLSFPRLRYRPSNLNIPTVNEPLILLVSLGNRQVALQVDRFWGEQEVTIRQVEGPLRLPPGLIASTILNDGRVAPLVDLVELVRWIEKSQLSSKVVLSRTKTISEDSLSTMIMVVDDSINVRRLLAMTLEKAGYRVQQAKDGQEALEKIKDRLPIKAVVCDVEMPRLDGYGFLTQLRSQAEYKTLPVIMVTSRSGDKHRQIALNLGATDYFSKPFNSQDLVRSLKTVMQNS